MANIAWVGLGKMGLPMSVHLLNAGHQVRGYDLSATATADAKSRGILVCDSIAAATADAEFIFTMLPDGDAVLAAYTQPQGILDSAPKTALLIDSSTVSIASCQAIYAATTARSRDFVDAPVSGGTVGAEAGTLTFMIGGSPELVARASAPIESMSSNIFRTGGPTTGQIAKICNNLILMINLAATAEGAVLADRLGLDPKIFWDIASVSSADSWPLRNWYPIPGVVPSSAASRNFEDPTFTAKLARKDVSLAIDAAASLSAQLRLGSIVIELFEELINSGLGEQDCSAISKVI
jgi:3-hydroxyisobutyrate dehydrogenase